MEEYRQFFAEKCFRENFISYLKENEMHSELDQYENEQNNLPNLSSTLSPSISTNFITWQGFQNVHFDCDVKQKLENASFLQKNNQNPSRKFGSEYKPGFQIDGFDADEISTKNYQYENPLKSPEFKITVNYDQSNNMPGKNYLKESRLVFEFVSFI